MRIVCCPSSGKFCAKDAHAPDIVGAIGVDNLRRAAVDLDIGPSAVLAKPGEPEDTLALEGQLECRCRDRW